MRILFIADGRSPTALNWIHYFLRQDYQVHLVSTFACCPDERLASLHLLSAAFSGLKRESLNLPGNSTNARSGVWSDSLVKARTFARQWLGPLTLPKAAQKLKTIIAQVQPDLVHAFRIPYEGMLAALADPPVPLLVSVWGNDFTLHAPSTPWMRRYTQLTLRRSDALHTDCQRDIRLAHAWGFEPRKPSIVLPGGGGIQLNVFYPADQNEQVFPHQVINPRGIRAYIRNDTFFKAIPLVLARYPQVRFVCPAMAGQAQALRWARESSCTSQIQLLEHQTRQQMADLYRQSTVVVSPSTHDGTPNTLLEALACGCFPVAGDIESLREWIIPDVNGLLVNPNESQALANAIIQAIEKPELRQRARKYNLHMVAERAEYTHTMTRAEQFYAKLTGNDAVN